MPAPFSRSISLEWIYQSRGVGLGLSPHCLSPDGVVCQLWRDSSSSRQYFVETIAAASDAPLAGLRSPAQAERAYEFQSDTITGASCYPGGVFLYAISGGELYFLWHTEAGNPQSLALPIRQGDRFAGLQASGGGDPRRTAAILTLDSAGHSTTTLVESPEPGIPGGALRVVWSRTWPSTVTAFALSHGGEYLAVAAGDAITLLDRSQRVVWAATVSASSPAAAVAVAANGEVVTIDHRGMIQQCAASDGAVRWQMNVPVGESVLPDSMAAGLIVSDAEMKIALCALNRIDAFGELEAVILLLDGSNGDLLWEDSVASPINGVSLAATGAFGAISCQNGTATLLSLADKSNPSAPIQRALQERVQDLVIQAKSAYHTDGSPETAVRLVHQALDLDPGLCVGIGFYEDAVWSVRYKALADTKTISAQSLTGIEAALTLLPNDERLIVRRNALARLLAESIAREASAYLAESRIEDAIAKYVEALTIDRTLADVRASLLVATDQLTLQLLKRADAAFYEERFEEAIGFLERVSALRPGEAAITRRLELARGLEAYAAAMQLYVRQQFEESVFWFRKALSIIPDHAEAAKFLAYAETNVKENAQHLAAPTATLPLESQPSDKSADIPQRSPQARGGKSPAMPR